MHLLPGSSSMIRSESLAKNGSPALYPGGVVQPSSTRWHVYFSCGWGDGKYHGISYRTPEFGSVLAGMMRDFLSDTPDLHQSNLFAELLFARKQTIARLTGMICSYKRCENCPVWQSRWLMMATVPSTNLLDGSPGLVNTQK
ncbi:unnamed protein product [Fusarium venenatum]|uniref:Uncharacterized protein n=1 Tax=Fusarium venenatum TaxID=56646 RepID=A0A2L2U1Q9_9HYPO|nr:uncharacterized protein FVRRES_09357 [Fusarium venenatum]CEI69280.1 unnamed protein product [Fusarium venenatum]